MIKKNNKLEMIESSLSANRTTVRVKALRGAKSMEPGKHYWPSEDSALLFIERGWVEIDDTDYQAKLLKQGKELPKPKAKRKTSKED